MLTVYADRLGPLEAADSLRRVNEAAIAARTVRKEDGRSQLRDWEHEARAGSRPPAPTPAAIAALGLEPVKDAR